MATSANSATVETTPLVSIVIPAYNRERLLGATIGSVVAQSLTAWELVVVDDGSTDGTATVAGRFAADDARIRLISTANGGVARARNRGVAATDARSRFVALLDSDDLWTPDALATLSAALEAHPRCVAAHGWARCIDENGQRYADDGLERWMRERKELRDGRLVTLAADEPTTFAAFVIDNWVVSPGTTLIRREALAGAGPLDPRTAPADDWELMLRLSRCGDVAFVDRQVLWWRRHRDALSETSTHWRRAHFRVRDALIADDQCSTAQARVARIAYRRLNRSTWAEAFAALRARHVGTAARRAAKAVDGQARYARAVITRRLGHELSTS